MDHSLTSTISAVTVYPDRARVTCQGQVELTPGRHRLLFGDLPLVMEPDSVRAAGRGTAQVRLLGVDVTRKVYEEAPVARVRELEQEIEQVEDEIRALKDEHAVLASQGKYLDGLRQATVEYAKGLARGRTTVAEQEELSRYLQEEDGRLRAAARELEQKQRGLDRRLTKLRQELAALQSARPHQRYQASLDVEAVTAGSFQADLSYVVQRAGWQPLYDLRLLEPAGNGEKRALDVTYLAQVRQNTGQDWPNVELTVSTARAVWNQRLPELHPWYVDVYTPPPPRQPMPARAAKMTLAAEPQAAMLEAAAPAPVMDAEEAIAATQAGELAVTFKVAGSVGIPGDNSPHKATINHFHLEPAIDYLAVPRQADLVFRRVKAINTGPSPLLAGSANLFTGDEFIGTIHLDYTAHGDEIELQLGVEDRVTVSRELIKREVDKALLRDRRQLRYGYEIEVQNLLPIEARLEIHDQIPVSRHEHIKVRLEQITPEPAEHTDLNLLKWKLALAPGAKQKIRFEYLVDYPRSLQVVGLPD